MNVGTLRQMMVGREIADNFYRCDWKGRLTNDLASAVSAFGETSPALASLARFGKQRLSFTLPALMSASVSRFLDIVFSLT